MKLLEQARPRLVMAFADLAASERDKIVVDKFFRNPVQALYSFGCLIEAASIVQQRTRLIKKDHESINRLKEGLQNQLIKLFAFIDCPIDEDNDGNPDDKSHS